MRRRMGPGPTSGSLEKRVFISRICTGCAAKIDKQPVYVKIATYVLEPEYARMGAARVGGDATRVAGVRENE